MLRRYWRTILKVGGFIGLAIAGYFVVTALLGHSDQLEQRAANYSDEYTQNAEYRIKNICASAISKADCVDQANEAAREGQRKEQDLAAQNVTAWWTKVMGFAALIGMVLSAVGVWLVKTTFEETRKSNQIALQAASHEFGAYIVVEYVEFKIEKEQVWAPLHVQNVGRTAATEIRVEASLSAIDDWLYREHRKRFVAKADRSDSEPIMPKADLAGKKPEPVGLVVFWFDFDGTKKRDFRTILDFFENGPYPQISFTFLISWTSTFNARQTLKVSFTVSNLNNSIKIKDGVIRHKVVEIQQQPVSSEG